MTDREIELWARIAMLQAWLQEFFVREFRPAGDRQAAFRRARENIAEIAKGVKLPSEVSTLEQVKLASEIERAVGEMLDAIAARIGQTSRSTPPRRSLSAPGRPASSPSAP